MIHEGDLRLAGLSFSVLSYETLYRLTEEMAKLVGSRLQQVFSPEPQRFYFVFYHPSFERIIMLDMAPARPLILSTTSTGIKKTKTKTPLYNFLNAHFINSYFEKIEIAEKPNRTVRLHFGRGGDEKLSLTFKCFPHGQELKLEASEKLVVSPWREFSKRTREEDVTFVEPEKADGWQENESLFGILENNNFKKASASGEKPLETYHSKMEKKLELAIKKIDESLSSQKMQDVNKISELESEALQLQQRESVDGEKLNELYDEVRRLRKKSEVTIKRRDELVTQLEFLKSDAGKVNYAEAENPKIEKIKKQNEAKFSGTVVRIDSRFELWVGRTDWQNDDLIKLVSPHELWIHLRDYAGAHGVIRGPKKLEVPQAVLEFSCRVVAILSQSKKNPFSENQALDFIITPRKFIKKLKGAGAGKVSVERESVRRIAFKTIKFEVQ
jgi:hypothetical protein